MADSVRFETPENIQIGYEPAGLGTRFYAWSIDQVFVTLLMFVVFLVLIVLAAAFESFGESLAPLKQVVDDAEFDPDEFDPEQLGYIFIGLAYLALGLGSIFYFTACELLMRGQTVGKRAAKIRVVKADGFALDAPSVFLRNVFRVVDQLPPLWIAPVFSARRQRPGDMVAGTLVVSDHTTELPPVRNALADRTAADALHRFDARALAKLRPQDVVAIERLLERWPKLDPTMQRELSVAILTPLVNRLGVEAPTPDPTGAALLRFFEDLLAAEYRRQNRALH